MVIFFYCYGYKYYCDYTQTEFQSASLLSFQQLSEHCLGSLQAEHFISACTEFPKYCIWLFDVAEINQIQQCHEFTFALSMDDIFERKTDKKKKKEKKYQQLV